VQFTVAFVIAGKPNR